MSNNESVGGTILSFITGIIIFGVLFGIPIYFLWDIIKDIFDFIPSTQLEFSRLINKQHGIIFNIFAGIIILWGIFFNIIYRILLGLGLFLEEKTTTGRLLIGGLWILIIFAGVLPYLTYSLISNNLFGYYFDFFQMLSFIGTFGLIFIPLYFIEGFIGTAFIAPISQIIFYLYLVFNFV